MYIRVRYFAGRSELSHTPLEQYLAGVVVQYNTTLLQLCIVNRICVL